MIRKKEIKICLDLLSLLSLPSSPAAVFIIPVVYLYRKIPHPFLSVLLSVILSLSPWSPVLL